MLGFRNRKLFCNPGLSVLSIFAIISRMKSELVSLLQLCSCFYMDVDVLCFFFVVPWGGLQCAIVAFLWPYSLN